MDQKKVANKSNNDHNALSQGTLGNLMLNHENCTFNMDLMSSRNRLMPSTEDLGSQKAGSPLALSLRDLQENTHKERLSVVAVTIRIHYSRNVTMLRGDTPGIGDGHTATEAKHGRRFRELVTYCLGPRLSSDLL